VVMERNNYIPEDQISHYDAMGNPVAKPEWRAQYRKSAETFVVNEIVDRQISEILEGEFIINPTVDTQIEEIMKEADF